jgi:enoyl-CoA hydratase
MGSLVEYRRADGVATITMDDGKKNALSLEMFTQLGAAFDRAEADRVPVVLTGRENVLSGGFDLKVMMQGGSGTRDMVITGFRLAERLLAFPTPVVVACPGHAIAMGAFLLLAGDYRLGAAGPFKIGANEVAIGITMPHFGVEMCRQRLSRPHFHRAVINAEIFTPEDAVTAGFLDRLVPPGELPQAALAVATELGTLDAGVHAATKRRARAHELTAIRAAIEADDAFFREAMA